MNALVRGSRKNAANCDTHCDVRNSEIRQVFERILYIEELLDVYLNRCELLRLMPVPPARLSALLATTASRADLGERFRD